MAYFTSSARFDAVTFSFSKLETAISIDGSEYASQIELSAKSLTAGTELVDNASVHLSEDSIDGLLRVKIGYNGEVTNPTSQNVAIALNSVGAYNTFSNSSYKWEYIDGYYYLVNASGNLITCTAGTSYTLFDATHTVIFPDINKYNLEVADLNDVSFSIVAEAVQSAGIIDEVSNASELHTLLNDHEVFEEDVVIGYIVQFNTLGGNDVQSEIIRDENLTLPQVGGINVNWYDSFENGVYGNLIGESGTIIVNADINENKIYYAKYVADKITVMFESAGATSGSIPTSTTISYGTSGTQTVAVTTDLKKTGYTYNVWKTTIDGSERTFSVSNGSISIPKNIVSAGNAITISPKWILQSYTATFITNGEYITENGYTYNSTLKGYTVNYTIEDEFTFPNAVKDGNIFSGWEVTTAEDSTRWRSGDIYGSGEMIAGNYGGVTFTALFTNLGFTENADSDVIISQVSKVYGSENFTVYLKNTTGKQAVFTSSNTKVATIADVNYGIIKIVGVGSTTITATVSTGGTEVKASYTLNVTARDINNAILASMDSQTYTGSAITPNPHITDLSNTLVKDTDYTLSYKNNTNVGTATVTISGKGNYTGSRTTTFSIANASISGSITQSGSLTYNGSNQTPTLKNELKSLGNQTITVTYSTSSSGTYSSTVPSFKNAGTHTIYYKANASNHNEKTGTITITINVLKLEKPTATGTFTFNGSTQVLAIVSNARYSITGNSQINAGNYTAKVVLNDKANTSWEDDTTTDLSFSWSISPRNITNASISGLVATTYTGSAITPSYTVTDTVPSANTTLTSGTDYTGAFTNNTNVGTATLTLTGKGNYTGTKTGTFEITNATITGSITQSGTLTYNGSAQTPSLSNALVSVGSQTITVTYCATQNGTYSSTIPSFTASGSHTIYYKATAPNHNEKTGTISIAIGILKIAKPSTSGSYTYNGTAQTVSIASNSRYTISGNTGTNAGSYTAKVVLNDKTNTSWADDTTTDLSLGWTIAQREISSSDITITISGTYTYTGSAITPTYTVKDSLSTINKNLTKDTDFTLSLANNTNAGTATLTITGKGNYKGTKSANFTINSATITGGITQNGTLTYNGNEQTPLLTSTLSSTGNQALTITYSATQNGTYSSTVPKLTTSGTHTIYFKVTANSHKELSGSITIKINARNISNTTISTLSSKVYTGGEITQTYTVTDSVPSTNTTLKNGTDYTGVFTNNITTGTATLTITGTGNYTGTKTATFSITNASIGGSITQSGSLTYNGNAQKPTLSNALTSVGNQTITTTYSTSSSGTYSATIPSFTTAGTHTIYYKATAPNHSEKTGTITISIAVLQVAKPSTSGTYTYNGASQTVSIATSNWYTISGNTGTNAGNYTATVALKDKTNTNWTGSTTADLSLGWTIGQRSIASSEITITISGSYTYTGSAITPTYTVKDALSTINKNLTSGTDYTGVASNNTNAGTATLTVMGAGNYTGNKAVNFTIAKASIGGSLAQSGTLTYNGSAQAPAINNALTSVGNQAITITYSTSSSGSYSSTVPTFTSKGSYTIYYKANASNHNEKTGSFGVTVNILKVTKPSTSGTYTYNGASQTVSIATSSWYTISGNTGTNAGSYTATVALKDKTNTTWADGSTTDLSLGWTIGARAISNATISSFVSKVYTGSAITQSYSVTDSVPSANTTLTSGTDYTGAWTNNTAVGTATLTITGKGNYTGTKTATFSITNATITGSIAQSGSLTFNGSAQTASVSNSLVSVGSQAITVKYGTTSGTYNSSTVPSVTTAGNHTIYYQATASNHSNKTGSFIVTVGARNITNATISSLASKVYTGSAITQTYTVTDSVPSTNTTLTSGTDYTGAFTNNTVVGTATLTITGKGNYTGTKTATFSITNATITGSIAQSGTLTYSGSAQTPALNNTLASVGSQAITVKYGTTSGTYNTTSVPQVTTAGTHTIYYQATANNHNTLTSSFNVTVNPKQLSTPSSLAWSGGTASWSGDSNASSYTVILYKNGTSNTTKTGLTSTSYDFASAIQTATTTWTFSVQAITTNSNYSNSSTATSGSQTTYSVAYNMNSGSGTIATQYKIAGVTLKLSTTTPTRDGYNFLGWSTSSTATSSSYSSGGNYTSDSSTTLYAVWELAEITLTVTDTSSYYYTNSSLYTKGSTAYYKCSYCSGYSTSSSNSTGCSSSSHSYSRSGYKCTYCGSYVSSTCYHGAGYETCGSCGGDGNGAWVSGSSSTCGSCNGSGKILVCAHMHATDDGFCEDCGKDLIEDGTDNDYESCGSCGGDGTITSSGYYKDCSSCGGDGEVYDSGTDYATTSAYKCSSCSTKSTSSSGTGCYHSRSSTKYYLYTKQYGSGASSTYLSSTPSTGYYWHSTYGALKVGSTFTYSDGYTYSVTAISGTTLTARRQT